jgi:hypothetical protein
MSYSDSSVGGGAIYKFDQGVGGVLPVQLAASPSAMLVGATATLTWSSPTATGCTTAGAWTNTVATSGTLAVTPAAAGIYTYVLTCTDNASVIRNAYVAVTVNAPAAQSVDGGGGGGGAVSLWLLALLGATIVCRLPRFSNHK